MPFKVSGGKILDPQGRPWFGAGIDIAWNNPNDATTTNFNRALQLFPGVNFFRIANWDALGSNPVSDFTPFVNAATSRQIVVWIEHHDNTGNSILTGSALTNEQNWYGAMAQGFNGNDYLWFGTMNEPGWENFGGSGATPRQEDQQITTYHTIRNAGNPCPILFEAGPGAGRPTWNAPVQNYMQGSIYSQANLTNIIWDTHFYPWMVQQGVGTQSDVQNEFAAQMRNLTAVTQSADGTIPIIVGEFGNSTSSSIDDVNGFSVGTVLASTLIQGFGAWIWNQNGQTTANDALTSGSSGANAQISDPYGTQVAAGIANRAAAVPSQTISVNTPGTTTVGTAFNISGSLGNYNSTPTLNYKDDAGAFGGLPGGATVSTTTYSFPHPGNLAAGTHTVTVEDTANTAVFGSSGNFTISAAPTPITVAAPTNVTAGSNFTVSGSLATYSSPPTLQYSDDASGAFVSLPAGFSVTTTAFSFSHPSLPSGSHTVTVRDANNTSVFGASPNFIVAAAPVPVVVFTPQAQIINSSFQVTGALSNYSAAPTLNYADDSGSFISLPSGSTVSTTSFAFTHPGNLASGNHTISVRDQAITSNSSVSSPFAVSPYTYTVSTGPSATGPWTPFGQPVILPLDKVTGLTAGSTYFFQVITNDVATGLQSTPVVIGPVTIPAAISESPEATRVTAANQSILASQTPGTASNGPFDTWSITAAGGQVTRNGVTDATTAAITELFYHNHTIYQEASNGNGTLTPGWWHWNGSTWIAETAIPPGAP